jgi:hypothetical protein
MKGRWARDATNIAVAAAVFVGAFGFYYLTGPTDVAWMEGAEYQRRVAQSDIGTGPWAHPLFVFLSQPFLLLPWGELARRANWAAGAFSAGACLFVYLLLKSLLQMAPQFIARRVGVLAAVSLAVSHTFWMRAVTPGPEPLDALLLAAILFFLIRFANVGGAINLYIGMGILGMSMANNLLMVFLIPIVFIWARVVQPPLIREIGKVRFRGLAVFLLGASFALAVTAWGWTKTGFLIPAEQKTWLAFWEHMMLTWDAPLQESLMRFGAMLLLNFPPWTAVIGLLGLWELYRRQKYVFFLVFPLFLVYAFLVVTLRLPAPVPSYLPAWVFLSVAVGFGWWKLLSSGGWQGFAVAVLLCASPLAIYRYAPEAVRQAQLELRTEALLDVPKELPLDHLAFQLNPDRRDLPQAREFATAALATLPDGAVVLSPSRASELMVAPMRYLVDVEAKASVSFVNLAIGDELPDGVYIMGLHPPHPIINAKLATHHLQAEGDWFHVVPRSALTDRVLADAPMTSTMATATDVVESEAQRVDDDALDDSHLLGRWYGYIEPQGYPVTLWIQGAPGNLTGKAVLNEESTRPQQGNFVRLSSTVGAVLGSVEFGEADTDQLHVHIDATQQGNRLEGFWKVYELPELNGRFVVWKQ